MSVCTIHRVEKDKVDKKGRSYHWAEDSVMCWGTADGFNVKSGEKVNFSEEFDVPPLPRPANLLPEEEEPNRAWLAEEKEEVATDYQPKTEEQKMWRDKDDRIARLTLAKTFIQANVDFDVAVRDNDLKRWERYVLTGKTSD